MWLSEKFYEFDLADPLLHGTPSSSGYNSMNDQYLRGFMTQPMMRQTLHKHGLVTRGGHIRCTLQELNRYRDYLHRSYQKKMYARKV